MTTNHSDIGITECDHQTQRRRFSGITECDHQPQRHRFSGISECHHKPQLHWYHVQTQQGGRVGHALDDEETDADRRLVPEAVRPHLQVHVALYAAADQRPGQHRVQV